MPGTLFIIATPIGNLGDITYRAVETLQQVDLIVSEDTEVSMRLLQRYAVTKPMKQCNAGNESETVPYITDLLFNGKNIAYISEAGTPAISDPGYLLARSALSHDISVVPIPGVSACMTALMAAGLPCDTFIFLGFFPKKENEMHDFFTSLITCDKSTVTYVSVHKIDRFLQIGQTILGDRLLVIARELTKLHEEFIRGTFSELVHNNFTRKGEFTVIIAPSDRKSPVVSDEILFQRADELLAENGMKKTAHMIAEEYGLKKNDVYEKLIHNEKK